MTNYASEEDARLHDLNNMSAEYLQQMVREGLDIFSHLPSRSRPLLHEFVWNGDVERVKECLQTPRGINFNHKDSEGNPCFHYLCYRNVPDYASSDILKLIVTRLEFFHLIDSIDWEEKDKKGFNFVSKMAMNGKLSVLWPIIKHCSFFSRHKSPIVLTVRVNQSDWDKLGEDQKSFFLVGGYFGS